MKNNGRPVYKNKENAHQENSFLLMSTKPRVFGKNYGNKRAQGAISKMANEDQKVPYTSV